MDNEILKKRIIAKLESTENPVDEKIESIIENCVFDYSTEKYLGLEYITKEIRKLKGELLGFGVLQELFEDPFITEIMVNVNEVFYEKDGTLYQADFGFHDCIEVQGIIRAVCRKTARTVSAAVPITDACLPDGTRINMVMEPICVDGNTLTIRKFPKEPLSARNLIENGLCSDEAMNFLENIYKAKYNIFICGGAGTGKTTLLNVLANFTNENERLITIEDSAELKINGVKNMVRLETRRRNSEGKGEVTIRDLIRTSLRMRPDRIIVGEVRGAEAFDMLQAMNTGHEGSVSTGHANSAEELVSRLENMVIMDRDMPVEAARQQVVMALDVVICLSRPGGKRRITEICELIKNPGRDYSINSLFLYDYQNKRLNKVGELSDTTKMKRYSYG
jgi:pilus assembly protein CpaF